MVAGSHCDEYAIQCPEYKDSACCSWQQNRGMAENFKLIASVFGKNSGGGCDACATNLLNLWCGIVCSPRQSEFMHLHLPYPSINYRPDPMSGKDHVKVLELNVSLTKEMTCSLFDSCKNTAMASTVAAMKSSLGFLNFQMQVGAVGHGEYIHLDFPLTNTTAFDHHMYRCENYSEVENARSTLPMQAQLLPSIASETEVKQCPCGACRSTCDAHSGGTGGGDVIHVERNPIAMLDGFDTKLVALVYGVVVVIVFMLHRRKHS